jgi:hypothetical protein
MALDGNLLHVTAIDRGHELTENNLWFAAVLFIEHAENGQENQCQDEP